MYAPGADLCSLSPAGWKSPPHRAFAWTTGQTTVRRRLPSPPARNTLQPANHFLSCRYNLRGSGIEGTSWLPYLGRVTKGPVNPVTQPIGPMTAPEKAMPPLARLWKDESGQDLVEYGLVAACVGLASVTGIHGIASVISDRKS